MLSVRPSEFGELSTFRADFSDQPLHELMNEIDDFAPTGSLPLPDDTSVLQAAVRLERQGTGRIDIWSRIRDADGTTHTIRLTTDDGMQSGNSWHTVRGEVRSDLPRPLELLALQIYEPPTSPIGSTATLTTDSLHAINSVGEAHLISDFDNVDVWHPMAASIPDNAEPLDR